MSEMCDPFQMFIWFLFGVSVGILIVAIAMTWWNPWD